MYMRLNDHNTTKLLYSLRDIQPNLVVQWDETRLECVNQTFDGLRVPHISHQIQSLGGANPSVRNPIEREALAG